jgi:hypothetical protein
MHECRRCRQSIPRSRRAQLQLIRDLERILHQRNISRRNIAWAQSFAAHEDEGIRALATIVADIGRFHPGRRHRYRTIRRQHAELWQRLVAAGLVFDESDVEQWSEPDDATNNGVTQIAPRIDPDEPWREPEESDSAPEPPSARVV